MKLPKDVEVNGDLVRIEVKDLGDKHNGWYHPNGEDLIEIHQDLKGMEKDEKLMHEFGHLIFDKCSLTQAVPEGVEEIIVDQFAKNIIKNFILQPRVRRKKVIKKKAVK